MAGYMQTAKSDDWTTPKDFYDKLNEEFHFDYDPCPVNFQKDGLTTDWGERNFINPPYSDWQKWVKKGFEEYKKGKLCVFLLPSRTDTKAFHEIILANKFEVRFVKGRLKFGDNGTPAVFPSMVVIMSHNHGGKVGK